MNECDLVSSTRTLARSLKWKWLSESVEWMLWSVLNTYALTRSLKLKLLFTSKHSPQDWLFNGLKSTWFGGRFCWYSLRSNGADWQNFATSASLGLKVRVFGSPWWMVAKTVLGLVVGGAVVEIQATNWFDVQGKRKKKNRQEKRTYARSCCTTTLKY